MKKTKIEVFYYESPKNPKGLDKFNPFKIKEKRKIFTSKKAAISFAKKMNKKPNITTFSIAEIHDDFSEVL